MPVSIRPLVPEDAAATMHVLHAAFADLERRMGGDPSPPAEPTLGHLRVRHLATTDPGGAWIAEDAGEPVGAALALIREGLWGLSLLVVSPSHQSAGVGGMLLRNTLAYGEGARAGIILSSEDPRALRAYSRAGFAMRPAVDATGQVKRRPDEQPGVRDARWPADRDLCDAASRAVRTAAHSLDAPVWLEMGARMLVHDGGGFAVLNGGEVKALAAHDPAVAAALLRAALRAVPEGTKAAVTFITAGQEWAVQAVLDAGLELRPAGAVMTRGDVGPMAPYLPSGPYL